MVRADGPASCSHPQSVSRLPVCRPPCLGRVLHAHTRVHQSLAPCSLSHRLYQSPPRASACARAFTTVTSAFASVSHPSAFPLLSVAAPPRVPEGCISLIAGLLLTVCSFETVSRCDSSHAGLLSLPRAQRGSVSGGWPRSAACPPAPGMTGASAVLRPACGRQGARPAARRGEGVRWRGGIRARPGRAHQREGGWGARGGRTRSVEKGL